MAFDGPHTKRLYWGAWVLLGLFMATQDILRTTLPLTTRFVGQLLLLNLAQNLFWGLLSLITLRIVRRYPLQVHAPLKHWWAHLAAGVVITTVGLVGIAAMAFLLDPPKWPLLRAFQQFVVSYFSFEYLVSYWGVVGIHEGLQILKSTRERELRVSLLEAKVAQAQLRALQMQLNPHFLFNTLNAVSVLMHTDPATADRMLVKLSQLLRLSLEQSREEETSLGRELAFLEGYLEVERMRLGDRLRVVFEVPGSLLVAQVPTFVLQPLLENAIQHGICERSQGGTIHIRARQEGGMLTMEVQDDGQRPGAGQALRPGIPAPRDPRSRLELAYGQEQRLDLHYLEGGGAVARIHLPLNLLDSSPRFLGAALPT